MKYTLTLALSILTFLVIGQEKYENNQTLTYDEAHAVYEQLQKDHPDVCKLIQFGKSDHGDNIELFIINKSGEFQADQFGPKSRLLINNAIHPGEPCGVDASVKLAKDLLKDKSKLPDNVVIGIIPIYNVGGAQNRNCCSRANQNGPEEYGFRGNAKNLDLNRDFIKGDSKNTYAFYKIYHFLKPNIFVDTHTSNGADYQHIMTLITSQPDKMHPWLKEFTTKKLNPSLYEEMALAGYDMVPYVHTVKQTPDDGIKDYLESPRYSTGFTNLFNTIGYVTETHMLKTFQQRVEATYAFLNILIQQMEKNSKELTELKRKADYRTAQTEYFALNWVMDTTEYDTILFKGYEAEYPNSEVTGIPRLKYNEDKPWSKHIKYYNRYIGYDSIKAPQNYIIPQAWKEVVVRLQLNGVEVERLTDDVVIDCEVYYINEYDTPNFPYEGHYLHRNINVTMEERQVTFYKGDYVIPTYNYNRRFIIETLEPHAADSYFAWNFFDAVLQQKEWFSPYVFEETAKELLKENDDLRKRFNEKRKKDQDFAENAWAQLYFIYVNSDNYERTHNMYPGIRTDNVFNKEETEEAPFLLGW